LAYLHAEFQLDANKWLTVEGRGELSSYSGHKHPIARFGTWDPRGESREGKESDGRRGRRERGEREGHVIFANISSPLINSNLLFLLRLWFIISPAVTWSVSGARDADVDDRSQTRMRRAGDDDFRPLGVSGRSRDG